MRAFWDTAHARREYCSLAVQIASCDLTNHIPRHNDVTPFQNTLPGVNLLNSYYSFCTVPMRHP